MSVYSNGTRLFVSDQGNNRVLVWNTIPTTNHAAANFVLGEPNLTSNAADNGGVSASRLSNPTFLSSDGTRLLLGDPGNSRILIWNSIPTGSVSANLVLGQPNLTTSSSGSSSPSSQNLSGACGAFSDGTHIVVADRNYNRVLIWNSIPTANQPAANLVLGQPSALDTDQVAPTSQTLSFPNDINGDGTHLFVADTGYNRVLIWNTLPTSNDQPPDLVLGQPTMTTGDANHGGSVTAQTLSGPFGVFGDGTRLFVTDEGNSRVLIWNSVPTTNQQPANLVLGQADMFSNTGYSTSSQSIHDPTRVASDGTHLFVSDILDSERVLIWNSIPTRNQQAANLVLGQPDMTSSGAPGAPSQQSLYSPTGVTANGTRLFIADNESGRVMIWNSIPTGNQQAADMLLGYPDFVSGYYQDPGNDTMGAPSGVHTDGTRFFAVNCSLSRILVWRQLPTAINQPADYVLGQPDMTSRSNGLGPNSLNFADCYGAGGNAGGAYSDGSRLWATDPYNNRIVVFALP